MTVMKQRYIDKFRLQDNELIIFDMDGLLLDTERISIEAWIKACKELNYDLDMNLAIQQIGSSPKTSDDFYLKYMGENFPREEVNMLRYEYFINTVYERNSILKDGVLEVLEYLDYLGLKKAVATSTFRDRAIRLLKKENIYNRFDLIMCGDDVDDAKPSPEIHNTICHCIGVSQEYAIVIEDSDIGALSAYNAGIKYILVPDLKPLTKESIANAYATIDSLKGLITSK